MGEPQEKLQESLTAYGEAGDACGFPVRRLRVLLAEDNDINRMVESELVRRLGHEVTVVSNGREALSALSREDFDLVLMNVSMPVLDGITATREIRRGDVPRCSPRVPVVAVTGHAMAGDREKFLQAGMDDYLAKPFREHQLHDLLARYLASA